MKHPFFYSNCPFGTDNSCLKNLSFFYSTVICFTIINSNPSIKNFISIENDLLWVKLLYKMPGISFFFKHSAVSKTFSPIFRGSLRFLLFVCLIFPCILLLYLCILLLLLSIKIIYVCEIIIF